MKKLASLITAVLFCFSLFGQTIDEYPYSLKDTGKETNDAAYGLQEILGNYHIKMQIQQTPLLKNANTLKQKLDSVISEGSWKEEYEYVDNGKISTIIYSNWNGGLWETETKVEHTYESGENITETVIDYTLDNNKWKSMSKNVTTYDNNGIIIQYNSYSLKTGRWIDENKREYIYDEQGNETQQLNYKKEGNKWIYTFKHDFTHDSIGNLSQRNSYLWETDSWVNDSNVEYDYDANGNMTMQVNKNWEEDHWVNFIKYEYEEEDNIEFRTLIYIWENEQWGKYNKVESMKDNNGNFLMELVSRWEEIQWINRSRTEYLYDNEFAFEDLILPFTDANDIFNHMLVQLSSSFFDDENWVAQQEISLHYSEQSLTGIYDDNLNSQVQVYPNPAVNKISFNINGEVNQLFVELFDNQGRLIKSQISNNNASVSIEALQEGLYFYNISVDKKRYSGKFMVAR